MVDPYEFVTSPSAIQSKQTRRKSIIKTSKKRKSNEKPRRVSIRQANDKLHMRTRSNARDTNHLIDMNEKENNSNNGFTQLIQTKMMEVKKRQGKRTNKRINALTDDNQSPSVITKRQRSGRFKYQIWILLIHIFLLDNEDSSDAVPTSTELGNCSFF
jgi:hypothetical protein